LIADPRPLTGVNPPRPPLAGAAEDDPQRRFATTN